VGKRWSGVPGNQGLGPTWQTGFVEMRSAIRPREKVTVRLAVHESSPQKMTRSDENKVFCCEIS
jgi:hypothetical protein